MRQLHDEMTGMLEGEVAQLLCNVNQDTHVEPQTEGNNSQVDLELAEKNGAKVDQEYWTAALAQKGKTGKEGKGKDGKSKAKRLWRMLELWPTRTSCKGMPGSWQATWWSWS